MHTLFGKIYMIIFSLLLLYLLLFVYVWFVYLVFEFSIKVILMRKSHLIKSIVEKRAAWTF